MYVDDPKCKSRLKIVACCTAQALDDEHGQKTECIVAVRSKAQPPLTCVAALVMLAMLSGAVPIWQ